MAHLRKEAPDAVYLCSGHGRETADAYYKKETCTETSGYWQGTHRQPCPFVDWGDNEFLRKDLGYWINLEDDNVIPQNKGEKL